MTRKRTHRKVYALVNPILHAIEGCAITDTRLLDRLRMAELSALDSFKRGTPTIQDWKSMSDLMNLAEVMALDFGIGPEVLPVCARVEQALRACAERHLNRGIIGRVAGEYEALAELCAFHDLQRASIPRSTYERAIARTIAKVRNAPESTKVALA